jgi:RNA polymerase sigma-70 factor (ECF subfamily)
MKVSANSTDVLRTKWASQPGDAHEVVRDAFSKAYRKLDQLRENARVSRWLVRIALDEVFVKIRWMHSATQPVASNVQATVQSAPFEVSKSLRNFRDLFSVAEFREILRKSLEELTPSLRTVLVLRDIEGLSLNETAEALRLSSIAVDTRLRRGRLELRNKLAKYFGEAYGLSPHSRV